MRAVRAPAVPAVLLVSFALAAAPALAATLYNESVSGDLSNNQAAPTPLTLAVGTNSIIGTVNGSGDSQDWVALTVPAGDKLTSIILASYQSTDLQGFTGFQTGASFVGSAFTAGSYTGYSHFGTGAQNDGLPPTNLVGQDLLPLMANPTIAAGATGFTPPLGAGTYTFLIQQLGASTAYQFDYNVAKVPEPATFVLLGIGAAAILAFLRPKRRMRQR
jgi:hypothetical protein